MTRKTKGRTRRRQAPQIISNARRQSTGLAYRIKGGIVTLALWGLFPIGLADWIIRRRIFGGDA